ncbi:hypothetical protein LCGC14_0831190 [marine sediment metagenome]|uniref:Uncharacterized protein n=1 Tax=marine sediment metagenome TaxID=412755 RepID=A0A0F9PFU9_9ZZZZ
MLFRFIYWLLHWILGGVGLFSLYLGSGLFLVLFLIIKSSQRIEIHDISSHRIGIHDENSYIPESTALS